MATRNNTTGTTGAAKRILAAAWFAVLVAVWPAPSADAPTHLDGVSRAAAVTRRERSF